MNILGISCGHNANVCLVRDGTLVAHYEKERQTRVKDDAGDVEDLVLLMLGDHRVALDEIDLIASSWPVWPERGVTGKLIDGELYASVFETSQHTMQVLGRRLPALMVPHHLGHCAYAFHLSGFEDADIIAVDAGGNFTASVVGHGTGAHVEIDHDLAPGNIGSLWSMASRDIFGDILAAGKVMGLAPYGRPLLLDRLTSRYQIDVEGFAIPGPSWSDDPILEAHLLRRSDRWRTAEAQDLASSIQSLTNLTLVGLATELRRRTGRSHLCLSGGVALNGIANEHVSRRSGYESVYVPPAVDDRGLSIGFALFALAELTGRRCPTIDPRFLGRPYSPDDVRQIASGLSGDFEVRHIGETGVAEAIAREVSLGRTVALWCGRSESGPRALGHRSILADARRAEMADHLNVVVKDRETFRPFAPAILDTASPTMCEMDGPSSYMLRVVPLREEAKALYPAICHVDGSTRPQTVVADDPATEVLAGVLQAMASSSGTPLVVNTSFNVRGQPIVESPRDAAAAFRSSSIDALALEGWLVCRA
jgi:carbamoyltransferase